jgi:hypothetical protein
MGAHDIKCMAFGTVGGAHKFYFYAQAADAGGAVFLVELVLDLNQRLARATGKCARPASLPRFLDELKALVQAAVP